MDFETGKVKILVVDDADIIRNTLRKFLSDYDIEVYTCNDGLEGLQKAIEYKPNLIILDLFMPNLDGIRLLRVMKVMEETKHIPVIVISGHTDKVNVLSAMEAGAERIISKPLTKEVLVKNINEVLGNNFLSKARKFGFLSDNEKENISKELKKYYAKNIGIKKETLKQTLDNENIELLKMVVHELKGSSGTVGFNEISEMCKDIEKVIFAPNSQWIDIKFKCELLIKKLDELEVSVA
jgi:CheY-like chemotaxis protein